jgi:hypothetical protein
MIKEERAKHLLEKWSKILNYTDSKSLSGKTEIKLKTAILIESQEEWKNQISNAPVAQSEERSPD